MASYKIDLITGTLSTLDTYSFKSEGSHQISPQQLLYENPNLILNIPELEMQSYENLIVAREYNTNRGPIDVLMITSNADIAIIETKLLRNPESHRAVVAQAIDYANAFYRQNARDLIEGLNKSNYVVKEILAELKENDFWMAALDKNLNTGNFQLIILGDKIHPNVLGMVESIQSAPHMAFTIYLVELDPYADNNHSLFITPRVVSNTLEIERSVIRIHIDHESKTHTIESEVPEEDGPGTKPKLTPEEFLSGLSKAEFRDPIEAFWKIWREIGGDIRFGTGGLSAGIMQGGKRIPVFFIYMDRVATISESYKKKYGIPDEYYQDYKNHLKASQTVYDGYVIGNKVVVPFDVISEEDLNVIFKASIDIAKKLSETS